MNPLDDETFAMLEKRWKGARWTMWVCAEPDGEKCDSGTHPNILRHRCAAIGRFHEGGPPPVLATFVAVAE